jgi:hypothetical protein
MNSRKTHIIQMYDWGNRGEKDYNTTAKVILKPDKKLIKKVAPGVTEMRKLSSKHDVKGFDMPRPDIRVLKTRAGKIIRVGSSGINNLNDFKKYALPIINRSFSKNELSDMNVYIEYPDKSLVKTHFNGMNEEWITKGKKKFNIISILNKHSPPDLVHELVHAVRFTRGRAMKDIDKDEAETELESFARLRPRDIKRISTQSYGYYTLLKGDTRQKMKDDRNTILKCPVRGGIHQKVKKCFRKTNISKIKIDKKYIPKQRISGEDIDRYFQIVTPGGEITETHISSHRKTDNIKLFLKKKYGSRSKIYEWIDGKRKQV